MQHYSDNPIDISAKLDVIEHVHVGQNCSIDESEAYKALFKEFHDIFAWSYEEMPGIDPSIVVHEIKTYPTAKPVRKKLRQVHPWKAACWSRAPQLQEKMLYRDKKFKGNSTQAVEKRELNHCN